MPTESLRILIAEDETIIRLDLRELLEGAGFDVVAEARDGEEAVELARSQAPELALLDVKMPKLDGIDAARRILEERPIPIVMVTAYGEQELVERAVEAGVFGYLVKPFRESDLLPAITTARARHEELTALREEADSLAEALAARKAIERAKGLLMEREGLTEQDAFARLRKASQISGRPLKVVAEALIATLDSKDALIRVRRRAARPSSRARPAASRARCGSVSTRWPSTRRERRLTAMRPISSSGWRTVVSPGVTTSARPESSKPTTERSSRHVEPALRGGSEHADRHVVVEREDRGRPLVAVEQAGPGAVAAVGLELAALDERRGGEDAGAGERRAVAVRAVLGRDPALAALDDRDAAVAELEEMLGRRAGARPVRGGDDRHALGERHRGVDDDEGEALRLQVAELLRRLGRHHEDRAVGRAAEQPLDERRLALVLVARRAEDGVHLLLVERLGRAREDGGVVVPEDVGDREADQAGAALREPARGAVGREAQRADVLHHRLARLGRDVGAVVDDAGDRRDGDAGAARHVADRRPTRPVPRFRRRLAQCALLP